MLHSGFLIIENNRLAVQKFFRVCVMKPKRDLLQMQPQRVQASLYKMFSARLFGGSNILVTQKGDYRFQPQVVGHFFGSIGLYPLGAGDFPNLGRGQQRMYSRWNHKANPSTMFYQMIACRRRLPWAGHMPRYSRMSEVCDPNLEIHCRARVIVWLSDAN